jgi:signal transduction histidine kinase
MKLRPCVGSHRRILNIALRNSSLGVSRRSTSWLTLLLVLIVVVPSICLLVFMNRAVQNERLAVRQKLVDAYRGQLVLAQKRLETYWQQSSEAFDLQPPALFAKLVRTGQADAVVVFDPNGSVAYPSALPPAAAEAPVPAWVAAQALESIELQAAVGAYARLSGQTTNNNLAARAWQAQARCLLQLGKREEAIAVLTGSLADGRFRNAIDEQGRLIVANGELMALELLNDPASERAQKLIQQLRSRLLDYDQSVMSAQQRRFLMRELQKLAPDPELGRQLAAEELAAAYAESGEHQPGKSGLMPTSIPGVWQFSSPGGRVVQLCRTETVKDSIRLALAGSLLPPDVRIELVAPGPEADGTLVSSPAGNALPGWRLALSLGDQTAFDLASRQRARNYVWTGVVVVALVSTLAALALGMIRRQAALTQLRNDLVANVTHELKTPLASTRLLVETLLNSERLDEKTAREYLQLIARENLRLSRLIDNFLTFSRIQRNKYTFDFQDVPAASIAETAVAAMRERFNTPGCQFNARIPADLPQVHVDADAMVTALLNLLDNAYKYSGEMKEISLNATAENGNVKFSVRDNGLGLSPRDAERVFNRFFQVDQHLSRSSGGAGLGLSIVQFVVNAHGGTVQVQSEPERGSVFTVTLPVSNSRQGEEART